MTESNLTLDVTGHGPETLSKVREGLRAVLDSVSEQVITDCINEMQNQGIFFREQLPEDQSRNEISDGYHTFRELYDHRRALTVALTRTAMDCFIRCWRSRFHHPLDGRMFDGSFIVGIDLPNGTITYHYNEEFWEEFSHLPALDHAPRWDVAASHGTVTRLLAFGTRGNSVERGRVLSMTEQSELGNDPDAKAALDGRVTADQAVKMALDHALKANEIHRHMVEYGREGDGDMQMLLLTRIEMSKLWSGLAPELRERGPNRITAFGWGGAAL